VGLILVDSSVWIDHIRSPLAGLVAILAAEQVVQHPFVTAEVALGSLRNRERVVAILASLPQFEPVDAAAFLSFVAEREIFGTGLGFVDGHLLASAAETGAAVWSRDKRLALQAERLGLAYLAD
jgi:predicted nucleic acid-binding protein